MDCCHKRPQFLSPVRTYTIGNGNGCEVLTLREDEQLADILIKIGCELKQLVVGYFIEILYIFIAFYDGISMPYHANELIGSILTKESSDASTQALLVTNPERLTCASP